MSFKRFLILLPAIVFAAVVFESCSNKGCTDKDAINFNVVADKNDGSCIYCDSTIIQTPKTAYVIDYNFSSTHYLDSVGKIVVTQKRITYNDFSCGVDECSFFYSIENLVGQDFDVDFTLQYSGTNMFFGTSNSVTVLANQITENIEIPESNISNACGNFLVGTVGVSSSSTIVYH